MRSDSYPFKTYKIPGSRNVKKALNDDELKLLLNYTPRLDAEREALDFWIFSYLCNGMNFTDIAHLKKENVNGDFMSFIRQKAKRTRKKDLRPIKVALQERAKGIIAKSQNTDPGNPHLFPVLDENLSANTQRTGYRNSLRR